LFPAIHSSHFYHLNKHLCLGQQAISDNSRQLRLPLGSVVP
jgi:hypothetical protein